MAVKEKTKRTAQRKRKPNIIAWINDSCTGCAGSPICQTECPVDECITDEENSAAPAFSRSIVDPLLCIGCKKCTSKGPMGTFLEGCPWDAIEMLPLAEYEKRFGVLPY